MQNMLGLKLHEWKNLAGQTCTNAEFVGIKITRVKKSSWTDLHKCKMCWDQNYMGEKINLNRLHICRMFWDQNYTSEKNKLDRLAQMQNVLGSKLHQCKMCFYFHKNYTSIFFFFKAGITCTSVEYGWIKVTPLKKSHWTHLHVCKLPLDQNYFNAGMN